MISVRILPDAARELRDARSFYEQARPGLGEAFATEFYGLLDRILAFPDAWPSVTQHLRRGLLRRFPYAVLFEYEKHALIIHAVMHTKRHPDAWRPRG